MIYRDDDCNVYTDFYLFRKLHEAFIAEGKTHTVACIMKDLWQNHAVFYYLITAPNLDVELHGWEHKDYSQMSKEECLEDLIKALDYYKENSSRMLKTDYEALPDIKKITTFYAPWNKRGEGIVSACDDLGLKFCDVKQGEWEGKPITSFHWWSAV
jgi:hypothetical protein